MAKSLAWAIAGAVLATAGVARAQDAPSEQQAAAAELPWYQHFTTSRGLSETLTGISENDRLAPPSWTLTQRWGVTVDVREGQRLDRGAVAEEQAAVGAYYQFTPRVRLGGELSLGATQREGAPAGVRHSEEETAGVRIESAFRF